MKLLLPVAAAGIAGLVSSQAFAFAFNAVPEPGVLGLLAIGAVAGLVVWARNRRK